MSLEPRTSRVKNGTFQITKHKAAVSFRLIQGPIYERSLYGRQFTVTGEFTYFIPLLPVAHQKTEGLSECTAK